MNASSSFNPLAVMKQSNRIRSAVYTRHIVIKGLDIVLLIQKYHQLKALYPQNAIDLFDSQLIIVIHIQDIRKSHLVYLNLLKWINSVQLEIYFCTNKQYQQMIYINLGKVYPSNPEPQHCASLFILHTIFNLNLLLLERDLKQFGEIDYFINVEDNDHINILYISYFEIESAKKAKYYFSNFKEVSVLKFSNDEDEVYKDPTFILKQMKLQKINETRSSIVALSSSLNLQMSNRVIAWTYQDTLRIHHGLEKRTTFMIKNIPNKYNQKMLVDLLNKVVFSKYDFLYLRMDFKNHCNVGYAFINFIDTSSTLKFIEHFVGKKWPHFNSDKFCDLAFAKVQGKEALVEKFRNSSIMDQDPTYQPKLFFTDGPYKGSERVFPSPSTSSKLS